MKRMASLIRIMILGDCGNDNICNVWVKDCLYELSKTLKQEMFFRLRPPTHKKSWTGGLQKEGLYFPPIHQSTLRAKSF